ncbi:MAG: hypothetical protein LBT87_07010 [Treponema sp.]|jgi:hypothetical protein|nr:hypothetical protein [Treponema sp.]
MRLVVPGFLLLSAAFLCPALYGFDPVLSGGSLDLKPRVEYNRSFRFCYGFQAEGGLEFNDRYAILAGLSSGQLDDEPEINAFAGQRYLLPFSRASLGINFRYIYNGIPGYGYNSHSFIPFGSIEGKYGGLLLGNILRYTVYRDSPAIFEPVLAYYAYINIINITTGKIRLSIGMANFSPFMAGNLGSYFFTVKSLVRLSGQVALVNEFDFCQTGGIGLSSVLYGAAWRGGVRLAW